MHGNLNHARFGRRGEQTDVSAPAKKSSRGTTLCGRPDSQTFMYSRDQLPVIGAQGGREGKRRVAKDRKKVRERRSEEGSLRERGLLSTHKEGKACLGKGYSPVHLRRIDGEAKIGECGSKRGGRRKEGRVPQL